jgi:hypothetical protein
MTTTNITSTISVSEHRATSMICELNQGHGVILQESNEAMVYENYTKV